MNATTLRRPVAVLTGVLLLGAAAATVQVTKPTAAPAAARPVVAPAVPGLGAHRQHIVLRANEALVEPTRYRLTRGGATRLSRPSGDDNHLGGKNYNEYNDFSGQDWSGHFAAAMWTGQDPPARYWHPQQWRTSTGDRYHRYRPRSLPRPGDVLVWENRGDASSGHVAVVTAVRGRTITTVEGDAGRGADSVHRHTYDWRDRRNTRFPGPYLPNKDFRGFSAPS